MRGHGEPVSRGRLDRRDADARGFRETVLMVGLFSGVVLINGTLAILFIALMQALGLWMPVLAETARVSFEGADSLRTSLQSLPSGER